MGTGGAREGRGRRVGGIGQRVFGCDAAAGQTSLGFQIVDNAPFEFDRLTEQFLASLGGKSPRTYTTYRTGLGQYRQFLESRGQLESWQPSALAPTTLERFYGWQVRGHGPTGSRTA